MDLESFFRGRVDNKLVTASWSESVKARLGMDGVSQIWSLAPAWYFWLGGADGPYRLGLESLEDSADSEAPVYSALFSIKCYPSPDSDVFQRLSGRERNLIESDAFDHTNTPRFEEMDGIPPELFTVGTLHMIAGPEETSELFILETLDRFRVRFDVDGIPGTDPRADALERLRESAERDFPGRRQAFSLFDRLMSLTAFYTRSGPSAVLVSRYRGFETVCGADRSCETRESNEIHAYALAVRFGNDAALDGEMESLRHGHESAILVDWTAAERCRRHAHGFPPDAIEHINPLWWEMAEMEQTSDLASVCGCPHDHTGYDHGSHGPCEF